MRVHVECYSGYKADQRPIRFQLGDRVYIVEELLDQWYSPDYLYFKVRADDGNLYILKQNQTADEWTLEAFRRMT